MILDTREPNVLKPNPHLLPGNDLREYLVQFGEAALWVRGWSIVPIDKVVWRSDLGDDSRDGD